MATPTTAEPVTIVHVAHAAGVSTQTVSRVINNRPDVAPATRRRVKEVIDRLGYQPNAIARGLVQQRTHTIGVVAAGLEYYGPSRTLVGIEHQASELGYSLLLSLLPDPETSDVDAALRGLLERQVDGILWEVPEIGGNHRWMEARVPTLAVPIVLMSMHASPAATIVDADNRLGGRLAGAHLVAEGYRKIGMITGPQTWWDGVQRRLGWEDALRGAGIPWDESQIVAGDWSPASGARALQILLDRHPDLEAIFAGNDQMALGLLHAAQELGRRIPHDLAVVGYDNIPEAAYLIPPLTTIRQQLRETGALAVRELNRLIEARQAGQDPGPPRAIYLPPEIVVRASSPRP